MRVVFLFATALVVALAAAQAPTLPTWITYSTKVNTTAIQPGMPSQTSTGVQAWQVDSKRNMTAWRGDRNPFVADFNAQEVYFVDIYGLCQFWCPMQLETPCDSQLDGNAFCGYDYENLAKYQGDVTLPTGKAHWFHYIDGIGPIAMASHDVYIDAVSGLPTQSQADFFPFGHVVANFTSTYTDFLVGEPDASYFAVTNQDTCQEGDSDSQCSDVIRQLLRAGVLQSSKAMAKLVLTEQALLLQRARK